MTLKVNSRKIQRWFRTVLAFFAAAVFIASCSDKDDNDTPLTIDPAQPNDNVQPEQPTPDAPKTYTLSIPATLGGDASLSKAVTFGGTDNAPKAFGNFVAGDRIFVYDVTLSKMVSSNTTYLSPSNISDDGKSCTLTGSLTETIQSGDKIILLYNPNYNETMPILSGFSYNGMNGNVIDGGVTAELEVKSIDGSNFTTESDAVFQLCQSIFRFKFVDDDNKPISVKNLYVESYSISNGYTPLAGDMYGIYAGIEVSHFFENPASDYLNVSLCIRETNNKDALSFTVFGNENKVYKGTKNAPSKEGEDGFKNGKYYYNSNPIQLEYLMTLVAPEMYVGSDPYTGTPEVYSPFTYFLKQEDLSNSFKISGESKGYSFTIFNDDADFTGHLILENLNAATIDNRDIFLFNSGNLILDIQGENNITCKKEDQIGAIDLAINVSNGDLKISGNGKLVITVIGNHYKGLEASNFSVFTENGKNPNNLAAEGYTVTLDEKDNGDGTYTYTYTVGQAK